LKFELSPIRRREAWTVAGIAALYLLIWIFLPVPSFWGLDSGIKYQGIRAFAETGSIGVPFAGREFGIDPAQRSLPHPFSVYRDGTQTPVFSTLFMMIGGALHFLFGARGAFLLSLIGGWGVLAASWLLWSRQRGGHDGIPFLLAVGLGSPLVFYSLTLWEHSIAAALTTLGFAYISVRREGSERARHHEGTLLAGICIGFAAAFRTEAVIIPPILLIFWRFTNRSGDSAMKFLFGVGIAAITTVAINVWMTGEVFPLHLLSNIPRSQVTTFAVVATRVQNIYALLIEGFDRNALSFLLIIPLLLLTFWRTWRTEQSWWPYMLTALILVAGLHFWFGFKAPNRIAYAGVSGGLLWVSPLAALALFPLQGERRRVWALIWSTIAVFILTVSAFFPGVKGIHWGPRMIVVVIPLIMLLAVTRAQRWWEHYASAKPVIIALFIIAILNQGYSVALLTGQRVANDRLNDEAAAIGDEPVLTPLWYLPGDCGVASFGKPWFLVSRGTEVPEVLDKLKNAGFKRFSYIEGEDAVPESEWNGIGVRKFGEAPLPPVKLGYTRTRLEFIEGWSKPREGG